MVLVYLRVRVSNKRNQKADCVPIITGELLPCHLGFRGLVGSTRLLMRVGLVRQRQGNLCKSNVAPTGLRSSHHHLPGHSLWQMSSRTYCLRCTHNNKLAVLLESQRCWLARLHRSRPAKTAFFHIVIPVQWLQDQPVAI